MGRKHKFIQLVDWDEYVYPDRRKKLNPPYPWYKQKSIELDTLNQLDGRLFGALCRLRMLACQVGNHIECREQYIRVRCGVTRKTLERLIEWGLVELVDSVPKRENHKKINGTTPITPESWRKSLRAKAGPEGEGETEKEKYEDSNERAPYVNSVSNNCKSTTWKQPPFEHMTQACIKAGVRGSDYVGISDIMKQMFDLEPSANQLNVLERQINDRRHE